MSPTTGNYTIPGQLPFQPGGNPLAGAQGGLGGLAQQYGQAYNSALSQNQALYERILGGYQQTLGNQVGAQQAIAGGYNNLYNNVLGGIKNIGQSQSQAIADVYAQQSGALGQQLANAGLGNTTVAGQMQRGPLLDEQKAQIALANQMAQLTAGYQSNLGMAGLNQANQANMQNTAEANQQLGFMNTVQAQYPNAQDYYGLYQQQGQWQQAQADRDLALQLAKLGRATVPAGGGGGFSGGLNHSMDSGGDYAGMGGGGGFGASAFSGQMGPPPGGASGAGYVPGVGVGSNYAPWAGIGQGLGPGTDLYASSGGSPGFDPNQYYDYGAGVDVGAGSGFEYGAQNPYGAYADFGGDAGS